MKLLQHLTTSIILSCLLFSCSKGDSNKDAVPLADTILTKEKLIGKWEAENVSTFWFKNDILTDQYTYKRGGNKVYNGDIITYWNSAQTSYITFVENDSFYQSNLDGKGLSWMFLGYFPEAGRWQLSGKKLIMPIVDDSSGIVNVAWDVMEYTGNALWIRHLVSGTDSLGDLYQSDSHIILSRPY
ncbi:MAG TPA: hypothetical protein PL009_08345 [Flavipsychrobacter sp.]|nr:hypothetical protein [Flavipsychrobacter sp.]